jgi:hypothetical protein
MAHPGEGVLQAFIDGELAADERARVAAHLDDCATCRAEVAELGAAASVLAGALARTDVAADLAAAREALSARVSSRPAAAPVAARPVFRLLPADSARRAGVRRAFLRAAVLVLLAAGGASAALPGGAVRRFFVGLWQQTSRFLTGRPAAPRVSPARAGSAAAPAPALPAGVSVLPQDGLVRIVVHDAAGGLRIRVRLVDTDRASVEAAGAAVTARFETAPGRIEVNGGGAGELRIGLPRVAQHATVVVDGKPAFSKNGAELRHFVPIATAGTESVYQVRP